VGPDNAPGPGSIGVARGNGQGGFAPGVETQVDTTLLDNLQTFVTTDGGLLALWASGGPGNIGTTASTPVGVRFSQAGATGPWSAAQTVITGATGGALPSFAANASGRAAVLFPLATSGGTTLRSVLRTSAGTWGAPGSSAPPARGGSPAWTRASTAPVASSRCGMTRAAGRASPRASSRPARARRATR
jgi:hypothetical protein